MTRTTQHHKNMPYSMMPLYSGTYIKIYPNGVTQSTGNQPEKHRKTHAIANFIENKNYHPTQNEVESERNYFVFSLKNQLKENTENNNAPVKGKKFYTRFSMVIKKYERGVSATDQDKN